MKKFLLFCLVFVMAVSIVGCVSKTYEVSFDTDGGTQIATVKVDNGFKLTKPADPTKAGMEFDGWYKDAELTSAWNFDTDVVTDNIILYAKWNEVEHTHDYTSSVTQPTCTADGYTTYTCECGDTYTEDGEAAKGHTPGDEATCTAAQTCTVCGETLDEAKGHTPGTAATCTAAQLCTACGETLDEAKGHKYESKITAPTCTEGGYTTYTCACGDTYTEDGEAAKGHTPGTAATCTTDQKCTACGETLDEAKGHTPGTEATCTAPQLCTVCGETLEAAKGHTPGAEATCTVDKTCTVCGETLEAAKGHTPGDEATCTAAQTCTVCGETVTAALGHVPVEGETCDNATYCDRCKETLESFEHTFVPATCTEPATCACGTTKGEALGHDYVAKVTEPTCTAGGYTTHTCSRCSDSYVDTLTDVKGHTPGTAATCTTDQKCTACGETLDEAKGHTPGAEATCIAPQLCTVCGETLVAAKGHTEGPDATCTVDKTCTVCGYVFVKASHNYTDGKCTVCGEIHPDWVEITYVVAKGTNDERNVAYFDPNGEIPTLYDLECSGYTFVGWYTSNTYQDQYKITTLEGITEDVTLYAFWRNNTTDSGSTGGSSSTTTPEVPLC